MLQLALVLLPLLQALLLPLLQALLLLEAQQGCSSSKKGCSERQRCRWQRRSKLQLFRAVA